MQQYKHTFTASWINDTCPDDYNFEPKEGDGIEAITYLVGKVESLIKTYMEQSIYTEESYTITLKVDKIQKIASVTLVSPDNFEDFKNKASQVVNDYFSNWMVCSTFYRSIGISEMKYNCNTVKYMGKCSHTYEHKEFISVSEKIYSIKECKKCKAFKKFIVN